MVIHDDVRDVSGSGGWDKGTGRYVPIGGGSRSRLPVRTEPDYPRYPGFVGIDERLTENLYTVSALYAHMGGRYEIPPGKIGQFIALLLQVTVEHGAALEEQADEEQG